MPNLVGIGLSQVPTNSMLGGLAYQSPDNASIKDLDLKNLSQINSEIADTAVDIFIYDTSKDSDGGAWRKRTTHTSWYNETLGTTTRGTRREFPAVAVIVLESTRVTIYDGDDPNLPMWMVFNRAASAGWTPNTTNILGVSYSTFTSISMLNGIFAMGADYASDDNNGVLIKVSFVEDTGYFHGVKSVDASYPAGGFGRYRGSIAERDSGKGHININDTDKISNAHVYSVAMHVQPNASIDTATGLPVPTIAVGTNYHMTVIRDDGATVDYQGFNPTQLVEICSNSVFGSAIPGNGINYLYKTDIKTGSANYNTEIVAGGTNWYANSHGPSGTIPQLRYIGIDDLAVNPTDKTLYRAGSAGFDIIRAGPTVTNTHAILPIAYVASDYNTGYMVGDIKGAFLSDTDATNATASTNLASGMTLAATARLTSHTYDDGDTSWQMVDNSGNANGYVQIYLNGTTPGKQYLISLDIDSNPALDSGYDFNVYSYSTTSQIATFSHWDGAGAGTLTAIYTSTHQADNSGSQSDVLSLYVNATTANITNFTVREATEADRSVNNNSLAVYGTVTKSAVATGAELVAYSGFNGNNSNYLEQPYNSDLDFGTGDCSIMYWFYQSTNSNYQDVLSRQLSSSTNGGWTFQHQTSGVVRFYVRSGGGYNSVLTSDNSITTSSWTHVAVVRTGNSFNMYINGVIGDASGGTETGTMTLSNANLRISTRLDQTAYPILTGNSIALVRLSASAPSAEQIKKIYEDEKVLFQENAACTLYGSSDAVTTLAYDEVTEQLHVGTSSGRSDFQGLRRINNTTTAVTTAISAHDEFIVEQ